MRKIVLSLLLAGAAASPAFAQRDDGDRPDRADRSEMRAEREAAREERRQAREQAAPVARPQIADRQRPAAASGEDGSFRRRGDGSGFDRAQVEPRAGERQARREQMRDASDTAFFGRDRSASERGGPGGLRQPDRALPNVMRNPVPVVSDRPRDGTRPAAHRDRRPGTDRWSGNWRKDHRYDWRGWRDRNRSLFHVGIYFDPFGSRYRPYDIGGRLWPSYYGQRYWINDPWMYRLPYAPPGYRWIRYWDDAILVDTWSGQVVDVIRNFFW